MKNSIALLCLTLPFAQSGKAAGYSTNFNSGYDTSQQLAGQQGWVINDATPNLSWLVIANASIAGAVGGYHDAPAVPSVRVSHPLSLPLVQSSLNVDINVQASTASFPGRDAFGVSAFNLGSSNLLTIAFEPHATDPTKLNIHWFTGAGSPVVTGMAIFYDAPYQLDVDFAPSGANASFTATVTGATSFSFNGTLTGLAGETFGSIGSDFTRRGAAYGDNWMAFDNVAAVPEPSTGILSAGLLAAGLLWRRRKA